MLKNNKKIFICFFEVLFSLMLVACARDKNPSDPIDPYETFNRRTYEFNRSIDRVIIRPVAKAYDVILPNPIKKGVDNVFNNVGEVPNLANDILQLDFHESVTDVSRFAINSTIGIAGIFDVATKLGLERNYEDLGLTFAKWGAKKSPYVVLPILGPSTVRDALALPINLFFIPWTYLKPVEVAYGVYALRLVDIRARLLPGDKLVKESFDPYIFIRNAYLQRRDYLMDMNSGKAKDTYVEEGDKMKVHHQPHKIPESTVVAS